MINKIIIIRGDDCVLNFVFSQNGTILNITGYKIYFTAKRKVSDSDDNAVIKKDWTSHTDPTHGVTQTKLSKTETSITPGIYVWDLQIKSLSGDILSTLFGSLEVVIDITNRTS